MSLTPTEEAPVNATPAAADEALSDEEVDEVIRATRFATAAQGDDIATFERDAVRRYLDGDRGCLEEEDIDAMDAAITEIRARRFHAATPAEPARGETAPPWTEDWDIIVRAIASLAGDAPEGVGHQERALSAIDAINRIAERIDYLTGAVSVEGERGEKAEREAEENDASWGEKIAQVRAERDEARRDVKQHLVYFGFIAEAIGVNPHLPPSSIVSAVDDAFGRLAEHAGGAK